MPHYKCEGCRTRLYTAVGPPDLVGDLCPSCGALLEPVGELAEIVGFQSIKPRDGAADDSAPGTHPRIADRVHDLLPLREAIRSHAPPDRTLWVDDGGSVGPEVVAKAIALPIPDNSPGRP
jgi:hypothetical protein